MDVRELKDRLNSDVERLCKDLLPAGKQDGREWAVGSVAGEAGQSLRVHLTGTKAGVWKDFATDQGGDLIDLWMAVKGQSLPDALQEIKRWLGIVEPEFHTKLRPVYKYPAKPAHKKTDTVAAYLKNERLLTLETIKAFRVESAQAVKFKGGTCDGYYLPYYRGDDLIHWKIIGLDRPAGKKLMTAAAGTELCLFGWQALPANAREVVITEGEIDAMTLHQMGIPALSVPNGATSHTWIDNEFDNLARFETIYLWFDTDEAGQKCLDEVAQRLGIHRCMIVRGDFKDPNEALQIGLTSENLKAYLQDAESIKPEELKPASAYAEAVKARFEGKEEIGGVVFPWRWTQTKVRLRLSELSIWTGINSHGKSQALGQVMLEAMLQGNGVCIASMELKPDSLLYRMTRQATAMRQPSFPYIDAVMDWLTGQLWLFDVTGSAKADRILEVFKYARQRHGVRYFVVDSLMKCGIAEDDYRGQKAFVDALCDFKNAYDCHVALVAHSRKGENDKAIVGKMDVKGTGAITDLADSVFTVWRNKIKEEKLQKNPDDDEQLSKPDGMVICDKQRNGEWEGRIALWFDVDSFQYMETQQEKPKRYVKYTQMEVINGALG